MVIIIVIIMIIIIIINKVHEWHLFGSPESKQTLSCVIVTN